MSIYSFAVMNVQKNLGFVQMFTFIACLLFSFIRLINSHTQCYKDFLVAIV